jgi:hypothetical protein
MQSKAATDKEGRACPPTSGQRNARRGYLCALKAAERREEVRGSWWEATLPLPASPYGVGSVGLPVCLFTPAFAEAGAVKGRPLAKSDGTASRRAVPVDATWPLMGLDVTHLRP